MQFIMADPGDSDAGFVFVSGETSLGNYKNGLLLSICLSEDCFVNLIVNGLMHGKYVYQNHRVVKSCSQYVPSKGSLQDVTCDYQSV